MFVKWSLNQLVLQISTIWRSVTDAIFSWERDMNLSTLLSKAFQTYSWNMATHCTSLQSYCWKFQPRIKIWSNVAKSFTPDRTWRNKEHWIRTEMQKAADAADISVLFFSAGADFWAILGHFWAISAILGHFWANLGNFGSFLGYFG